MDAAMLDPVHGLPTHLLDHSPTSTGRERQEPAEIDPKTVTVGPTSGSGVWPDAALPLTYGRAGRSTDQALRIVRNLSSRTFQQQALLHRTASTHETPDALVRRARTTIAEDGVLGAKKAADRLVSSALAAAGPFPGQPADLMTAIVAGFDAATSSFDQPLPELAHDTLELVRAKLDAATGDRPNSKGAIEETSR